MIKKKGNGQEYVIDKMQAVRATASLHSDTTTKHAPVTENMQNKIIKNTYPKLE